MNELTKINKLIMKFFIFLRCNVPCVCCRFNATYTMLAVCIFNFLAWDFLKL